MKCACEFDPVDGKGRKMCAYHEKAFKYLAKEARDTERLRIVRLLDDQAARSTANGDTRFGIVLRATAQEIAGAKAPIKVPILAPHREDLVR